MILPCTVTSPGPDSFPSIGGGGQGGVVPTESGTTPALCATPIRRGIVRLAIIFCALGISLVVNRRRGNVMKLGIIGGAGLLGSTTAFAVAQRNLVDEIVLIDIKENLAKTHVMDMEQAISEHNQTSITYGSWDALTGCDIVIMTASMPERKVSSRIEFLADNLKIVQTVAGYIAQYCLGAVFINATNPVDPFGYIFHNLSGMSRQQIVGFSRNDTLRLRWAIAKVLHVPTTDVQAMVIGEHGEAQVPVILCC